jgi:hypothetical protein
MISLPAIADINSALAKNQTSTRQELSKKFQEQVGG